jgi:hypothetical protein
MNIISKLKIFFKIQKLISFIQSYQIQYEYRSSYASKNLPWKFMFKQIHFYDYYEINEFFFVFE